MTKEISLEDKLVGEIEGEFIIPSYQRGYRWERKQVETLLNDIMDNGDKPYCLQPVVVRKRDDGNVRFIWYEVQNVEDKDAISLFTRLNIGRIPLTNAGGGCAFFRTVFNDQMPSQETVNKLIPSR